MEAVTFMLRHSTFKENKLKAEDFINQGLDYRFKLNDKDKAIEAFTEAIKINPQLSPAFLNRGSCYFAKGLYDNAIADYNEVLLLCPRHIEAYKIREWAEYSKKWAENHKNHPVDVSLLTNHILVNSAIDSAWKYDYVQAFKYFEQALEDYPDNAFVFYQRGLLYAETGECLEAINNLTQAIKIAPSIATLYYDRGNFYREKNIIDKAIDDYSTAIQLYPQFSDSFCNRGIAFLSQGKYELAINDFESALQINPDDEDSQNNLQNAIRCNDNKRNDKY